MCYPLVCVHCGPVVDFFITKQTSLHPFDFVRNLFHLLVYDTIIRNNLATSVLVEGVQHLLSIPNGNRYIVIVLLKGIVVNENIVTKMGLCNIGRYFTVIST